MENSVMSTSKINECDTDFCQICQLKLQNNVSMYQHILARAHNKIYQVKMSRSNNIYGLYIRGYSPTDPTGKKNLLQYFSNFGTIVWAYFSYDCLLLDYSDEFSVQAALNYPKHRVDNRILHVRRRYRRENNQPRVDRYELERKEAYDVFEYLLDKLKGSSILYQQLQILQSILQADVSAQFDKCENICFDLQRTLASVFPWCGIHPFGSTITGLSFEGSDLDVFISGINKGDDVLYLRKVRNILYNSMKFRNAIVIAHAKIPLLKCIHVETNMSCDINVKNMLGVCNTQLIKYYLGIDNNIKMLLFTLKYWARVHKFTGQNHLFTNYSLALMVIYFLEQAPYRVPTVFYLQSNPRSLDIQDGWNGGFQRVSTTASHITNTPLLQLFMKFFDFYSNFEYGSYIICPYLGCLITKDSFKSPDNLPSSFNLYKNYIRSEAAQPLKVDATICIQDPLEHARNVTPIISEVTLLAFVSFCRQGKKLCLDGETNFLYKLFTEQPPDFKPELLSGAHSMQFVILMGASLAYLKKTEIADVNSRKDVLYDNWFNTVDKFLIIVLRDFLKFNVKEDGTPTQSKNKKIEGQSDIHDTKEKVGYTCSAKLNLWGGRKLPKNVSDDAGLIERESAIANHLCDIYKNIKPVSNIVELKIYLRRKEDPPGVIVDIKKLQSYKKTFKSFATYFVANFMTWFQKYEKELNLAVQ